MAAIHQTRHGHSGRQRFHEESQNVVVDNLSVPFKVDRDQGFVVAIVFVPVPIGDATAVSGIMQKDDIACLAVIPDAREGIHNVGPRRSVIDAVVDQAQHVFRIKAVDIFQVFGNIVHIVVTTTEFTTLTGIIDANQNGSFHATTTTTTGRDNVHGFVDINHARRCELWYLIEPHLTQHIAHATQEGHPSQWLRRGIVVVQYLQDCRSAGPSRSSLWIG
mmetsp:Transcript_8045/g.12308  ORF Transcript_8045/g.12308 Transcript_8045/m.12308 type:complete len:219 (-) Transcript_8045:258-914(-)